MKLFVADAEEKSILVQIEFRAVTIYSERPLEPMFVQGTQNLDSKTVHC